MNIGVSGYFGYGNLGDEIFLRTWKQFFGSRNVSAISPYSDIKQLDRIIVGGGDLIIPSHFTNAYWNERFLEKPTHVYGVGVPAHGARYEEALYRESPEEIDKYALFLRRCVSVTVRNKASQKWLQDRLGLDAACVPDIAWAYNVPGVPFSRPAKPTVGVSIRANNVFRYEYIVELCKHAIDRGFELLLIPIQMAPRDQWGDYALHEKLRDDLFRERPRATINIIPVNSDIDQQIRFIEYCDLYITQRMHGMLMSLRMHTPVLPMAVGIKFYEALRSVSSGHDEDLRLERIVVNTNLDAMKASFDRLADSPESQISSTLKAYVQSIEEASKASLKQFAAFLC